MAGAECETSVNGLFAGARLIGGAGARFPASGHDSSGHARGCTFDNYVLFATMKKCWTFN